MIRKILLGFLFLVALPAHAETVFLKPEEALKLAFHGAKQVTSVTQKLNPDQKKAVEKSIGGNLAKTDWNFYIGSAGDGGEGRAGVLGYAVIDNEIGKTQPITFMTVITPDGRVKSVEILVYREAHGDEVKQRKFLDQYNGKTGQDPLRLGQDVTNMSGATLSSRALTLGVKRDLAVWNVFYGSQKNVSP